MATDTKQAKVEFGSKAYSRREIVQRSTQRTWSERSGIIKMTPGSMGESSFSCHRRVNYANEKVRESYRKINKMLGGN